MKEELHYLTKSAFNIVQIILKTLLAVFISVSILNYLNIVFQKKDVYRAEDYKSLPENSLDAIVLGSSHAQYSFIPSLFYEDTNMYSFVLGSACQPYEVSYEMMKEALKTQSPKLIIMEVFTAMPLRSICETDSCYVIAHYEMTDEEKYNTINYLPKEKAETYYNDFINNHNSWRTMEDFSDFLPENTIFKQNDIDLGSFGYIYNEPQWPYDNYWTTLKYEEVPDVELDPLDLESLNHIYQLCQEKGITLFLYKTPMDGIDPENQAYLEKVWEWAREHEVQYIDFIRENEKYGLYMQIHCDSFHAYINGAAMITDAIAEKIKSSDFQAEHANNNKLDTLYTENAQSITLNYLNWENNISLLSRRLKNSTGYLFLRYNSEMNSSKETRDAIANITKWYDLDYSKSFYVVVHDKQVIEYREAPFTYSVGNHTIYLGENQILVDGEEKENGTELSILYMSDSYSFSKMINIRH